MFPARGWPNRALVAAPEAAQTSVRINRAITKNRQTLATVGEEVK